MTKRAIISGCLTLILGLSATHALAQETFRMDVDDHTPKTLEGTQYFVFNHSGFWDYEKKSFAGVRNMISIGTKHNIPRIAMVGTVTMNRLEWKSEAEYLAANTKYFFKPSELSLVVGSSGGPHHLEFAKAKKIFFAGGFLDLCLCEAMRDTLRWTDIFRKQAGFEVFIVRDAVYDYWGSDNELVNLEEKWQREQKLGTSASAFAMFNDYLSPRPGCGQNTNQQPDLNLDGVTMRFYVDDQYATSLQASEGAPLVESDLSPRPGVFNVRFIHSRDLEKYLDK